MTDSELLHEYARTQSNEAFAALVSRYIRMVYSCAKHQLEEPQLAEEVTQAVFIILARKAPAISPRTILSGWLFKTTRFVAAKARRAEARRRFYERQAAEMDSENQKSAELGTHINPLLDGAISRLSTKDQNALLLRFFQLRCFYERTRQVL